MKIENDQLLDLGTLSIQRCRTAFMSVGQLIEDDGQRASLLIAVATDFVRGAAATLEESDGISEEKATIIALARLLRGLGVESVRAVDRSGVKMP